MAAAGQRERSVSGRQELARRLRAVTREILKRWEEEVRRDVPAAARQDHLALLDHLPQFLEKIADFLVSGAAPESFCGDPELCTQHGEQRAHLSAYTLKQVLHEYRVLRRVTLAVLEEQAAVPAGGRDLILDAIEAAMQTAATEFVRERTEALQRSEAQYRSLVESAQDYAILTMDPAGCVLTWSPGAERMTGYAAEEIVGRPGALLFTPEDQERGVPEAELRTATSMGRALDERWHQRKDGSRFFASGVLTPLVAGSERGFVKVLRDITDRWRIELVGAIQLQVSSAVGAGADLAATAPEIIAAIARSTAWDFGALWTVDPGDETIRATQTWHAPELEFPRFDRETRAAVLHPGEGVPGSIWASRQALWIPDLSQAASFPRLKAACEDGLTAGFAFPVLVADRVVGVFEFFSRFRRPPDTDLLTSMAGLGGQVGQFIERQHAEAALAESEARKSAVLEAALDAIITINHEDRVLEFNPAAERIFGYTRAEAMGQRIAELIVPPAFREAHLQGMARYLATGEAPVLGQRLELPAQRKDGSEFLAELAITRIPIQGAPLFTAYLRDVSEQKRLDAALREQAKLGELNVAIRQAITRNADLREALEQFCQALVHHVHALSASIWLANEAERLTLQAIAPALTPEESDRWEQTAETVTGRVARARAPLLGELFPGDSAKAGNAARQEPTFASGYPLIVDGRLLGVLAVFTGVEISEAAAGALGSVAESIAQFIDRKRLEDFLLLRTDELLEADQRKNEFLATLAHELRNPLAPIRTAVEVMRLRGDRDPALGRARDTVERQVHQLSRLVDDLLDVARITRGQIELRKEVADLGTIVAQAVHSARPEAARRGLHLSVSVPLEPVQLEADPTRLEQVVTNLLNNAVKFTPAGGSIQVTAECDRGEAVVRVRDTGKGIPAEMLPRIWDLFTQVNPTIDRAEGGLGLGLTLVRNLVRMHGGTVTAHSGGPGTGSEFVVRLPSLPSQALPAAPPRPDPGPAAEGLRVLVVDDNVDAAETLADLLPLWGHAVETVHTGAAALEAVLRFRPNTILLDIGLPGMDGYEVARRLRANPETEGLCLIALTGYGQEEDRQRTREAGFDYHVVKPVDPSVLRQLLSATTSSTGA